MNCNNLEKLVGEINYKKVGDFFSEQGYSEKDVINEYGEFSEEARIYSHYLANKVCDLLNHTIPLHEIGPQVTKKNLDDWMRDFYEKNDLKLPRGFSKKTKNQLWEMYDKMSEKYYFKKEDTFKHSLPVEPGFKIRGYKHAEQIKKWPKNEVALRNLVYDVTRKGNLANNLDYSDLLHQYNRILAVAEKILESKNK
tara:strand:- start:71 stop:658 length:588 start_codon:yes stop_codon:yes gene_type:complete